MQLPHAQAKTSWLAKMGLAQAREVHWQLSPAALVEEAIRQKEGVLSKEGALVCNTGRLTGRSPRDKFIVRDDETRTTIWWGPSNIPLAPIHFDQLYQKITDFLHGKNLYIRDVYASASAAYRLGIRVVNTKAWHNLFCHNLFLRPSINTLSCFLPEFTIINVPEFEASPATDGTHSTNFTIINFQRKIILIGGTGYAGEMKKSIFIALNYLLPNNHQVLPMHCAANVSENGDTAIFFGISGTGKTALSADPARTLIGDDEHGWCDEGVFNFEGGCYAKTVDLSPTKEPQIFQAIKFGTVIENMCFVEGTRELNYGNTIITENMRSAYPIEHINNFATPSVGGIPKHIFFLTCDAQGVLPPIAKLSNRQAMYHFLAGYTAKISGAEIGLTTPQATFSACFGSSFLPLHPLQYVTMLGKKMECHTATVWLVNTGWIGGVYGVGKRIPLHVTRAIISAALSGELDHIPHIKHPIFRFSMPTVCPGVPGTLLYRSNNWESDASYTAQARILAQAFMDNFQQYEGIADHTIKSGGPQLP